MKYILILEQIFNNHSSIFLILLVFVKLFIIDSALFLLYSGFTEICIYKCFDLVTEAITLGLNLVAVPVEPVQIKR